MLTPKKAIFRFLAVLLLLISLGLLYLTNTGLLSVDKPYVYRISDKLSATNQTVAFTNVAVIPMEADPVDRSEWILEHQTVLIHAGVIETIGDAAQVIIPAGAKVIDGTEKYLLPGLVDMHVHIQEENEILLFVAAGVTSVRNMWGNTGMNLRLGLPDQLGLRREIDERNLLGPTIYTTGPVMEGQPPTTPLMPIIGSPQEAARSVTWQKTQGYDFVKVYDNLSPEVYAAILEVAQAEGLPVVGHAPKAVGLEGVLAGGQSTIEHLTAYLDPDKAELIVPADRLDEYARMTADAGVWNCPTLGVYLKNLPPDQLDALENLPGMDYISPRMRLMWRFFARQMSTGHAYKGRDYTTRIAELNAQVVRALHEAGAGVILGTDSDNPYLVPGLSLLDEIDYLVLAGFTPNEAIRAGTRDAAEVLGKLGEFGTIAEGKRADLLLVAGNPLEDVGNLRQRAGVMLRGRWLPEEALLQMLAELKESYSPTFLERIGPLSLVAVSVFLTVRLFWPRRRSSDNQR